MQREPENPKEVEHKETRTNPINGNLRRETWSFCSCGAAWSHPKTRSIAAMDDIFESHKAYFNRPKMETL